MVVCLTNIERVKRRRVITSSDNDDLLEDLVEQVSDDFVGYMNRHIRQAARTEVYQMRAHNHIVSLRGSPVVSVTSVKHSASRDFSGVTAADASSYVVDLAAGTILYALPTNSDPSWLEVTYTGGLVSAADDDAATLAVISEFPSLASAADMQVIEYFNRRGKSAGDMKFQAGAHTFSEEVDLLKSVTRVLNRYRRIIV